MIFLLSSRSQTTANLKSITNNFQCINGWKTVILMEACFTLGASCVASLNVTQCVYSSATRDASSVQRPELFHSYVSRWRVAVATCRAPSLYTLRRSRPLHTSRVLR